MIQGQGFISVNSVQTCLVYDPEHRMGMAIAALGQLLYSLHRNFVWRIEK